MLQQAHILGPRYFDSPEICEMTGYILRIEQTVSSLIQAIHQSHQSNLRRVRHPVEHRFPEKGAVKAHTVEASRQFIVQPCFHRMSEPELVQMNIALNDFFADPRLCPFTTGSDHLLESRVQPKLKLSFFQSASQTVRDVKRIEQNDPARIWRKPGDLSTLHRHREYPSAIGFKEER